MFETIWLEAAAFVGGVYIFGPAGLRYTMRFSAHCNPKQMAVDEFPEEVAALFLSRIPEMASLGFESLGCYDCGSLTSETRSYMAYFCNRLTNDFANVTVMVTPKKAISYFEFSAAFTNGMILETNTNSTLPLTPGSRENRVFRFPNVQSPQKLYDIHRQLVGKYAPGLWPRIEARGEELKRFVRVIENYGPRHARIGYMQLAEHGQSYELTWKGAFLMTWRGLWPALMFRRFLERHAMQIELDSLEVGGITALQKA